MAMYKHYDDSDLSEEDMMLYYTPRFPIKPYQFEPLAKDYPDKNAELGDYESESESDVSDDETSESEDFDMDDNEATEPRARQPGGLAVGLRTRRHAGPTEKQLELFAADNPAYTKPVPDGSPDWCECGHCTHMPTAAEEVCCGKSPEYLARLDDSLSCITQHPGFIANCISPYVTEVSFYEFVEDTGPVGDDEPIHGLFRYLSCRRLIRWIFRKIKKRERKVIPACCMRKIRQAYTVDGPKGFKYPAV